MAERSEHSAEALLGDTARLLAEMHARAVLRIEETAAQRDDAAQIKLIDASARAGRNLGAFVAMGRKLIAELETVEAAASVPAVNPDEEVEMDDDAERTPESLAELRAEIGRRLAALEKYREFKRLDRLGLAGSNPADDDGAPEPGPPPAPPA